MEYTKFTKGIEKKVDAQIRNFPDSWSISENLHHKINLDGSFREFYGYTSVIKLSDEDRQQCSDICQNIVSKLNGRIAVLPEETYHLTIHAFANETNTAGGKSVIDRIQDRLQAQIAFHAARFAHRFADEICMKAIAISAGSDVISLKFAPKQLKDYEAIYMMFESYESVFQLNADYLPHVSIAYFTLQEYNKQDLDMINQELEEINSDLSLEINLSVKDFFVQRHYSMGDFRDII